MTLSEEQLEWIVNEVIRRLLAQGVAVTERGPTTAELAVSDRVVTLRTIEGKLTNVQQLRVPARSVVTPAVKDELKQRQIALVRQP